MAEKTVTVHGVTFVYTANESEKTLLLRDQHRGKVVAKVDVKGLESAYHRHEKAKKAMRMVLDAYAKQVKQQELGIALTEEVIYSDNELRKAKSAPGRLR